MVPKNPNLIQNISTNKGVSGLDFRQKALRSLFLSGVGKTAAHVTERRNSLSDYQL